jgi:hypothetical protein
MHRLIRKRERNAYSGIRISASTTPESFFPFRWKFSVLYYVMYSLLSRLDTLAYG